MLSWFGWFGFILTTTAPILLVYGVTVRAEGFSVWGSYLLAGAALVALAGLFPKVISGHLEVKIINVERVKGVDKDALALLAPYVLPFLGARGTSPDLLALIVILIVILVVLTRGRLFHVNPVMLALGYHFFEASLSTGATELLITRRRAARAGSYRVVSVSDQVWLEVKHEERSQKPYI